LFQNAKFCSAGHIIITKQDKNNQNDLMLLKPNAQQNSSEKQYLRLSFAFKRPPFLASQEISRLLRISTRIVT